MPGRPLKICAMPTASETAPPGRPATISPTCACELRQVDDRHAERLEHRGRRVDGEVVARVQRAGGDDRDDADDALDQHRAVADRPDVRSPCRPSSASCRSTTSAWKPEIAPQAIVMKTNGKSGPGMIGPPPPMNCENAGACSSGFTIITPMIEERDRADLHERAEVVARRQQHPDRQRRGGDARRAPSRS